MTLEFTVREPISINRAYMRRGGNWRGKGLCLTQVGRDFKERVKIAGLLARQQSMWPTNLWEVGLVEVAFDLFDVRMDTDGPRKMIKDALEGVLYVNDRIAQDGLAPLPVADGNGRRVVVRVTLLHQRSASEAKAAQAKAEAAREKRLRAKKGAA